jgi:hypothetical protein
MLSAGGAVPDPAAIIAAANDDLARDNDSQTFVTVVLAAPRRAHGRGADRARGPRDALTCWTPPARGS